MFKVKKDYATLYKREDPDPTNRLLATHVDPFQINDGVPSEAEVEAVVQRLHPPYQSAQTFPGQHV